MFVAQPGVQQRLDLKLVFDLLFRSQRAAAPANEEECAKDSFCRIESHGFFFRCIDVLLGASLLLSLTFGDGLICLKLWLR